MSKFSVAIFGSNGALGAPTIAALESSVFADHFKFPILVVTRDASSKSSTDKVKYVEGDINKGAAELEKQLSGTDVLISLLGATPDALSAVAKIVIAVKPKLYIPSQFGVEIEKAGEVLPGFLSGKTEHSEEVRKHGIKVVDIYTGHFQGGPWLTDIVGHVGIDANSNTVKYLGDPDAPFAFTNLNDVGRVVASVASQAGSDFPDKIRVQTGSVTPRGLAEKYEKKHGVKLESSEVSKEQALAEATPKWKKAVAEHTWHTNFLYWLNVVRSQGLDKGTSFSKNQNELVNPGQKLWKWEKF